MEDQVIEIQGTKGKILSIDNTSITLETESGQTIFPLKVLQSEKVTLYN
jgi:hypothetical protein